MALQKTKAAHSLRPDLNTWQHEVSQLHRNYFRIGLLLNQSTILPTEARLNFQFLRKELVMAMERFTKEVDQPGDSSRTSFGVVLNKHVNRMHSLNRSIDDLVKKHTYC